MSEENQINENEEFDESSLEGEIKEREEEIKSHWLETYIQPVESDSRPPVLEKVETVQETPPVMLEENISDFDESSSWSANQSGGRSDRNEGYVINADDSGGGVSDFYKQQSQQDIRPPLLSSREIQIDPQDYDRMNLINPMSIRGDARFTGRPDVLEIKRKKEDEERDYFLDPVA